MHFIELKKLLIKSWSLETCAPGLKDMWQKENPSIGQCAITSLIVNDLFAGKIMRCMTSAGSHYYNLIDNKIIDFTVEQFCGEKPKYYEGEERTREYLLSNDDTKNRYEKLLYNLKQTMRQIDCKEFILVDFDGNKNLSDTPGVFGGKEKNDDQKTFLPQDLSSEMKEYYKSTYGELIVDESGKVKKIKQK